MSTDNEKLAVIVNSILLRHQCLLSLEALSRELKSQTQVIFQDELLLKFLKKFPQSFSFRNVDHKKNRYLEVRAITDIALCQKHAKKNGSCDGKCGSLHICKYFFLSGRCSFGEKCSFGHDYRSRHNELVFRAHLLDVKNIALEHLRFLVCQTSCRNVTTMPQICTFYNTSKTCSNKKCKNLHMCKYFLESTCKFNDCKRNHSVQDLNVTDILEGYGFNINQSPDEILQELRQFFCNEITQNPSCLGHQPEHHRSAEISYSSDQYAMKYPDEREIDFQPYIQTIIAGPKSVDISKPVPKEIKTGGKQPSVICIHNLRGKCEFGSSCRCEHKSGIYQWQWKTDTDLKWTDFNEDNNIAIEKIFSQPDKSECYIMMGKIIKIDFESMTASGDDEIRLRRLTTISSAIAPPSIQRWTTVWHWYWQNENGEWKEFGEPDINGWNADLDSDKIEIEYQKNPEADINFENRRFKYVLSFTKMKQINCKTNKECKVQRRTTYFHPQNTDRRTVDDVADGQLKCAVPKEWKVSKKDVIEHNQVKQLTSEICKQHTKGPATSKSCSIQPEHQRSAERCYSSYQYAMKYPDEREIDFQPEIRTTKTPTKSSAISKPDTKPRERKTGGKQPSVICIHNLRGKCVFGSSCRSEHKSGIYQWQWKTDTDSEWTDFNDDINIAIEKIFSQPDDSVCSIKIGGIVIRIDFESMTASGGDEIRIRRLTTISSAIAPPSIQRWTTVWHWYWQDENGVWIEYGEPDVKGRKADLDSDKVEIEYQKNPEADINFENGRFKYVLSFTQMKQINCKTKKGRKVQRRTTYFHPQNTDRRTMDDVADGQLKCAVPKEWKVTSKDVIEHYQVKLVEKNSQEFEEINRLFRETMSYNIKKLKRIENGELWSNYCHKKSVMKRKLGKEVEERQLFHGTTEKNIQAICRQGFDFRFSGKAVGTRYGKGSYFASQASYSDSFTDCKMMFVAKVLVGEFVKGNPSYVRPPPKDYSKPHGDLFDSCVDNTTDPKIFVIFDLIQVYPQYLITYC